MRLLLLAALLLHQDPAPEPKPVWRQSLTIMNMSSRAITPGQQISIKRPVPRGDIEVRHGGKVLASWADGDEIWFRAAGPIKEYERDFGYEIRYGGETVSSKAAEVFEFFDEPGERPLDPKKWQLDPQLKTHSDVQGLAVTEMPPGRSDYDPASLILLHPLPEDFIVDAEIRWEIREPVPFFAFRLEVEDGVQPTEAKRKTCDALIARLASDDIEERESALRKLISMGSSAVPSLLASLRTASGEARARVESGLTRIHAIDPPAIIRGGFEPPARDSKFLSAHGTLGKARMKLEGMMARKGSVTVTLRRSSSGLTELNWPRVAWKPWSSIEGRIGRIRFDFWGAAGGEFGAVWIKRIKIRRMVDPAPETAFGPREEVK